MGRAKLNAANCVAWWNIGDFSALSLWLMIENMIVFYSCSYVLRAKWRGSFGFDSELFSCATEHSIHFHTRLDPLFGSHWVTALTVFDKYGLCCSLSVFIARVQYSKWRPRFIHQTNKWTQQRFIVHKHLFGINKFQLHNRVRCKNLNYLHPSIGRLPFFSCFKYELSVLFFMQLHDESEFFRTPGRLICFCLFLSIMLFNSRSREAFR